MSDKEDTLNEESNNEEENAGAEEELVTTEMTMIHIVKQFYPIIIGIIISIYVFFKVQKMSNLTITMKSIYILLPILISIILFTIINSPSPVGQYYVSLLYGDEPITTDYKHKSDGWPFVGSTTINIFGKNHLFVGNLNNGNDALLLFNEKTNEFDDVISKTNIQSNTKTYSAVSYDINNDGYDDLIVGKEDGVYLYLGNGGYYFTKKKIVDKSNKVPLAIAVSDYDKDGKPDMYISYFAQLNNYKGSIFNDPSHGHKNILLKNTIDKNNIQFKDVTNKTNSGGLSLNTFTSAFVDVNNDGWSDIVLSHDSGEIEILKNNKGKFSSEIAFNEKGNWMGIAAGDVNNDGHTDLFLTNLGEDVIRDNLAHGDIKSDQKQAFSHALLINDKKGGFKEKSKNYGISGNGFGWGAIFADANLDGKDDLLFAQNTMLYPLDYVYPKPGYYYENDGNEFKRKFKYNNSYFGQTPMSVDINNDNIKDIVWINMNGPVNAYLNKNNNNYVVVQMPSDAEFLNAKIVLDTGTKKIYKENIHGGLGFGGDDNDRNIIFGLGKLSKIKNIKIYTQNDKIYTIMNPRVNSIIKSSTVTK